MTKTIVVVGVTGVQGSSVANTFLNLPGWKVRGITRDPSSKVAQSLAAKGVEMVRGDLDDKTTLVAAFAGANVVFSNTDYFIHLWAAMASPELKGDRSAIKYAYDREVQQGVNIAEAASSPETLKTLERFVFSSLSDPNKWSHGKYKNVLHYQSKSEVLRITSEKFPEVAARTSTVQIGHYVTNWKNFPALAPQKQADGTFVLKSSFSPGYLNPYVVAERDTGAFVKALVDLPAGTNLLGVSDPMTVPEYAEVWARVMGVKVIYEHITREEHFHGMPEDFQEEMIDSFAYVDEFGHTGGDPSVITPSQLDFKIPLTSVETYIREEDWSSIL